MTGITARNRANARKSTGPRTAEGKAVIQSNALRHGVLARPRAENVAVWYAIILDRPGATFDDLLPKDDTDYLALALAHAEAWVYTSEQALLDFEAGEHEVWRIDRSGEADVQNGLMILEDLLWEVKLGDCTSKQGLRKLKELEKLKHRLQTPQAMSPQKQYRLLKRYFGEARSKRKKAFAAWLASKQEARS